MSYISKEDLREQLEHEFNACNHMPEFIGNIGSYQTGVMGAIAILDSMPEITVEEKIGHWTETDIYVDECSECGCKLVDEQIYIPRNFCPNCGAKMSR